MFECYRALIALRRRLPASADSVGEGVTVQIDDALGRIVFERKGVILRVNLGGQEWDEPDPPGFRCALSAPRVTVYESESIGG
jgi:hypothetical protein